MRAIGGTTTTSTSTSHDTKVEERTIRATHEDLYSDWQLRINKYGWILPHGDQVE